MADQSGRRWLGLIAIALGIALIVVDITIVSVIIPSIIADLRISSAQAQWIQESYAIVLAALLLLVGRVADIVGARRVFIAGVVLFGVTSMIAGIAPGGGLLVAARFAQGTGAAMILPTSLALLNTSFTGKARIPARRDNHRSGPSPADGTDRPSEPARNSHLPPQHLGT